MLKTNSKVVRQKIRKYIETVSKEVLIYGYNIPECELESFSDVAKKIIDIFHKEKRFDYRVRNHGYSFDIFREWAQGLPIGDLFLYYYYGISAVTLIKDILEETEIEASKYTESQAEELLTKLIYREIINID